MTLLSQKTGIFNSVRRSVAFSGSTPSPRITSLVKVDERKGHGTPRRDTVVGVLFYLFQCNWWCLTSRFLNPSTFQLERNLRFHYKWKWVPVKQGHYWLRDYKVYRSLVWPVPRQEPSDVRRWLSLGGIWGVVHYLVPNEPKYRTQVKRPI